MRIFKTIFISSLAMITSLTVSSIHSNGQMMNLIASTPPHRDPIVIGNKATRIVLDVKTSVRREGGLKALLPRYRLSLILDGLAATVPPGDLYAVYLNLAEKAEPTVDDPRLIGTFNVFNIRPRDQKQPMSRVIDMTQTASQLNTRLDTDSLSITLVPGKNVEPDSDLSVAQVAISAE